MLSAQNLAGATSNAVYDSYHNLTSYTQPGMSSSVKTTMTYSTSPLNPPADLQKHLVRTITSPLGIKQEYTYDSAGNRLSAKTTGTGGATPFIQGTTAYAANMNHAVSQTDALGKTATRQVDAVTDTLTSVTDPNGQSVSYTYDGLRRVTGSQSAAGGKTYRNAYTYTQDKLVTAAHNTTSDSVCDVTYNFAYDTLGNQTTVSVGTQALSTAVYSATGDKRCPRFAWGTAVPPTEPP